MIAAAAVLSSRTTAVRASFGQQQRRTFVNWMTNYPDRVMEMKKIQMKGGTCLGAENPTWLKQPGDVATAAFGAGLVAYGAVLCSVGFYRLATGKGKKE